MNPRFAILDTRDRSAVAEYERAFHASFARVTGNRLIRDLWVWDDDARRLAVRIPYDEQVVYVAHDTTRDVSTALSVNVAMRAHQFSAFGFGHGIDLAGSCELLAYFTTGEHRVGTQRRFIEACFNDLRHRGLHTAYATTASRPLPTYRRIGGELLDERKLDGEMRYFLKFSLSRAWMKRGG